METEAAPVSGAAEGLASHAWAAARRFVTSELALVTAALIILTIIFFYDVIFLGRTLASSPLVWGVMGNDPPWGYPGDPPVHNPYILDPVSHAIGESTAQKAASVYRALQIPLWDANTALGRPLLASLDPQVVNPLRLPMILAGSPAAWNAFLMARFFIAGLFTYLFARRLGTNGLAAFAAAAAFSFSGFFMVYVNGQPPDFAMLVPVVLYSFELLFQRRSAGTMGFATVAVAMSVLSGNPEGTFALLMFGAGYYLARAATEAYRQGSLRPLRSALPLGACLSLGLALSAFALTSFIELSGFLNVGGQSVHFHTPGSGFGLRHDPIQQMISLFVPYFNGTPTSHFDYTGWTALRNYNYVGVAVPALAFIGIGNRRLMATGGWFFAAAALILVAKTYGVAVVNPVGHLPVLSAVDFAVYFAPAIAFSLAILAALGIDRLVEGGVRTRHVLAGMVFFAGLLGWMVWLNRGIVDHIPEGHLVRHLGMAFAVLAATTAVLLFVRRKVVAPQLASLLLIALILGELFFFVLPVKGRLLGVGPVLYGNDIPVNSRPERYDPFTEPPYVSFLGRDTSNYRVFSPDYLLYPNTSSVYDIDDIRGFTALTSDRYLLYVKRFINPTTVQRFTGAFFAPFRSETEPSSYAGNPMFDLLNVKYVIAQRGGGLTEAHDHSFIDAWLAANPGQRGVSLRAFRIEGEDKPALFQHPPSSLSYDLTPQEDSRFLRFSLAMDPQVWDRAGDGVLFKVAAFEGNTTHPLYSRWVDPKNEPADRQWIDGAVDLGRFVGKEITLLLETSPGANPAWDWAGWGGLRLAASPETPPESTDGSQYKLIYEGEVNIYQNLSAFPRAFIVHRALPATDMESAVELMQRPDFDPSRQAVVEDLPESTLIALASAPVSARSAATITNYGDAKVELRASMKSPGLLVLSDTYYPGWKAYVDGKETPIYATDLTLRSIYLGPGEHAITFEYDPVSFRIGWMISVAALLALAGYAAFPIAKGALRRYWQRPRP